MTFRPRPGDILTISDSTYSFQEHPVSPGMPYGQSGRRGTVYQLEAQDHTFWALKIFLRQYREPRLAGQAEQIAAYAGLPGLQACRRSVLSASRYLELLQAYPDLDYAVLMPWINGRTWVEITLASELLPPDEALQRARSLATVLLMMEERSLAHCDLSGPNLILPPEGGVELIDLEEMFGTQLVRPEALPGGSPGYAHKTAPQGLWNPRADRFAGAVLLAEILGWVSPEVLEASWGEGFFSPDEMGTNSERFLLLRNVLNQMWDDRVGEVFAEAWFSDTLAQCPTFSQWVSSLPPVVPHADIFTSVHSSSAAVPSSEAGSQQVRKQERAQESSREEDTRACPVCNQQVGKDLKVCPFCESELESVPAPRQEPEPEGEAAGESEPGSGSGRKPRWIAAAAAVVVIGFAVLSLTGVISLKINKQSISTLDPSITQFIDETAGNTSNEAPRDTPVPATQPAESGYQLIPTSEMPDHWPDTVMYLRLNPDQYPLDDVRVRRALSYALDRVFLAQEIRDEFGASVRPASSLTVPEVLGMDAEGYVGYDFQPNTARLLLSAAGYTDGAGFPELSIMRYSSQSYSAVADLVLSMWEQTLGVKITSVDADTYEALITGQSAVISWRADYPDPYSFLHDAICGVNVPEFYETQESNQAYNEIINPSDWAARAAAVVTYSNGVCRSTWDPPLTGQVLDYSNYLDLGLTQQDPEARLEAYLRAEEILVDQEVGIIPLLYWEVR